MVGSLRTAPVRGDEEFKAGDIVSRNSRPLPLFPRCDFQIAMLGLDMEEACLQASQPSFDGVCLLTDGLPFADRVFTIEITGPDDLSGVYFLGRTRLHGELLCRQGAECPAVVPFLVAPFENVA